MIRHPSPADSHTAILADSHTSILAADSHTDDSHTSILAASDPVLARHASQPSA